MQFLSHIKIKSAAVTVFDPNFYSENQSFQGHSREIPGSRFEIVFTTVGVKDREGQEIWGFKNQLGGRKNSFTVILPKYSTPLGSILSNPLVSNATAQGNRQVSLKSLSANGNELLLIGDHLKFAGHNKVYCVTAILNADSSGLGQVEFEPQLQKPVALNELVTVINVPFSLRLRGDKSVYPRKASDEGYTSFKFDCIEAI